MRRSFYALLIVLMITGLIALNNQIIKAHSQPEIEFIVEDIYWGTPQNNPITVNPGDINVPLTIVVRNHSNETLRGVTGTLDLVYPFIDYKTQSNTSSALGQPVEAGDVFNQTGDILPSGSFTLTFYLNIDDDATKGAYEVNLTISYNYKYDTYFLVGEPKTLSIIIRLYNRAPVIYSVLPSATTLSVLVGETIDFTCKADDPDNDSITYEWVLDGETVLTGSNNYTFIASENLLGSHTLSLEISDGNLTTANTWTINVQRDPNTQVSVSTQYIFAGYNNPITINIENNIWDGTVQVNLAVSQYLVIIGNTTWTFYNVTPSDRLSINITIYAPETLIGQPSQLSVSLNYNDEFGQTYTENYGIGLVVRGQVIMHVYDLVVSPSTATPGNKISISGTVLNTGNVKALFTNISILPSPILELTFNSKNYIGDTDPNSPVPFTLEAYLKSNVANDTYEISLALYYQDDLHEDHVLYINISIVVEQLGGEEQTNQQPQNAWESFISSGGIALVGTIITIAVIAIVYFRRRGA